ncbi:MAG: recombinase family protein [Gaiellaceae bacterium]
MSDRVERLTYTRTQAAEALGVSLATLDRRVLPAIATIQTEWGGRLIPVAELERYLTERTQEAQAERRRPARPGRKAGLPPEILARIRDEHAGGKSLGEIARRLNADGVRTSQGGRQWWASTVRSVLIRRSPPETPDASTGP